MVGVRASFLDYCLVEMVAGPPGRVKVPGPATKLLLRALLNGRVPPDAWDRPKHGFTAPIGHWLRSGLRSYVEDMVFARLSLGRDLFNDKELRQLWEAHLTGRENHENQLWVLLMLEVWHQLYAHARVAA